MFCKYCGEQISDESKLCPKCGKSLANENGKELKKKKERTRKKTTLNFIGVISLGILSVIVFNILSRVHMKKEYNEQVELADMKYDEEDYQAAIDSYMNAENISEKYHVMDATTYMKMGHAYRYLGDKENAINYYNKALENDDSMDEVYWSVIDILDGYSSKDEALDYLEKAQKSGKDKESFEKLSYYLSNMKRYEVYERFLLDNFNRASGCYVDNTYIKSAGICFQKLADYDGDGWDDLIICYTKSDYDTQNIPYIIDDFIIDVYTYENGEVEQIATAEPATDSNGTKEIILNYDGEKYVFCTEEKQNSDIYVLQGYFRAYDDTGKEIAFSSRYKTQTESYFKKKVYDTLLKYTADTYLDELRVASIVPGYYAYDSDDLNLYLCSYYDNEGQNHLYVSYFERENKTYGSSSSHDFLYDPETNSYVLQGDYVENSAILSASQNGTGVDLNLFINVSDVTMDATLKRVELYDIFNSSVNEKDENNTETNDIAAEHPSSTENPVPTTADGEKFYGTWTVDSQKTNDSNNSSLQSYFGSGISYGYEMIINEDNTASWYIGIGYGGKGTFSFSGQYGQIEYKDSEDGSERIVLLTIDEENNQIYLCMDLDGYKIYWRKI